MSDRDSRQQIIDEEHLKFLSIGYMVSVGMSAFFSLFGLIYVFMGVMMGTFFNAESGGAARARCATCIHRLVFGYYGIRYLFPQGEYRLSPICIRSGLPPSSLLPQGEA